MDYVTVRELREKSGEIWQRLETGEEFVITRNGKPFALLVHTEPAAVEHKLRALRAARFGAAVERIQACAQFLGARIVCSERCQIETAQSGLEDAVEQRVVAGQLHDAVGVHLRPEGTNGLRQPDRVGHLDHRAA